MFLASSNISNGWADNEVIAGIKLFHVLACVAILGVALVAGLAFRWLMRRWIDAGGDIPAVTPNTTTGVAVNQTAASGTWRRRALKSLVQPVSCFIWIYGGYAAVSILLGPLNAGEKTSWILSALDSSADIALMVLIVWLLLRLAEIAGARLKQWAAATGKTWDILLAAFFAEALRLIPPIIGLILIVPALHIAPRYQQLAGHSLSVLLILAMGAMFIQLANSAEGAILGRYRIDIADNLAARKIHTQAKLLKKVALIVIGTFTLASMLMVFDPVRQLGASILASAGVAGIIIGFAAQHSLSTLFAGVQLALTQPIRLDDAVIVEGEWGRIEEITLTYVVVRIWDLRRLIVPVSYFIEKPFQNWTRVSADLLGSVFLYVDFTVPVKALREELDRILAASKLWDGKVKVLQVTDAKERTLELRILASASDSGRTFDLRCEVREKLVDFLQQHYPRSLPTVRTEWIADPPAAPTGNGHRNGGLVAITRPEPMSAMVDGAN